MKKHRILQIFLKTIKTVKHTYNFSCISSMIASKFVETEARSLMKQLKKTTSFSVKGNKQLQRKNDVVLLNEVSVSGT